MKNLKKVLLGSDRNITMWLINEFSNLQETIKKLSKNTSVSTNVGESGILFRVGSAEAGYEHSAVLTKTQIDYLLAGVGADIFSQEIRTVEVSSDNIEGHIYTLTIKYDDVANIFVVTNITSAGNLTHNAFQVGVRNDLEALFRLSDNYVEAVDNNYVLTDSYHYAGKMLFFLSGKPYNELYFPADTVAMFDGNTWRPFAPKSPGIKYVINVANTKYSYNYGNWQPHVEIGYSDLSQLEVDTNNTVIIYLSEFVKNVFNVRVGGNPSHTVAHNKGSNVVTISFVEDQVGQIVDIDLNYTL